MFGFSSFSEATFSSLVAVGDIWNEIRNNVDNWSLVQQTISHFARVEQESGADLLTEDLSFFLLEPNVSQYSRIEVEGDGDLLQENLDYVLLEVSLDEVIVTTFVETFETWQDTTATANTWTEV
jgi:hypothetical protein